MLKRILYCSTAQGEWSGHVPTDITPIIIQGRRYNSAHSITGFLCFKSGYYMQAIEGSASAITSLYERICADRRHTEIFTLLVEDSVSSRYFKNWSMKLSNTSNMDDRITQFLDDKWPLLRENNEAQLKRFYYFYNAEKRCTSIDNNFPKLEALHKHEFKVSSLPYINHEQSDAHDLLDIYAHLMTHWSSFSELCDQFEFAENNLYQLLYLLHVDKQLMIRKSDLTLTLNGRSKQSKMAPKSGFYWQLRSFFRRYAQ